MEPEPPDALDARVEELWQTLDTRKEGHLDFNGLKKGLRKMDHRKWGSSFRDVCLLTC